MLVKKKTKHVSPLIAWENDANQNIEKAQKFLNDHEDEFNSINAACETLNEHVEVWTITIELMEMSKQDKLKKHRAEREIENTGWIDRLLQRYIPNRELLLYHDFNPESIEQAKKLLNFLKEKKLAPMEAKKNEYAKAIEKAHAIIDDAQKSKRQIEMVRVLENNTDAISTDTLFDDQGLAEMSRQEKARTKSVEALLELKNF